MLKRLFLTLALTWLSLLVPFDTIYADTATVPHAQPSTTHTSETPLTPAEQLELRRLLIQDCGSCHGLRMTGGLGPALTPDALSSSHRTGLVATVLYGRPGTAMPPWRDILDSAEAEWIVDQLLEGLPPQ